MANPFTDHPRASGQTFAQHFRFAMAVCARALAAGAAAGIHAFFPFAFQKTASRLLQDLNRRIAEGAHPPRVD